MLSNTQPSVNTPMVTAFKGNTKPHPLDRVANLVPCEQCPVDMSGTSELQAHAHA